MLSLVYVSSATRPFSEEDLVDLLKKSRENNSKLDISGMLLHKDGNFIQVLEGPREAVRKLYTRISEDDRHRGVISLLDREIENREFADWSMGFRNLNDPALRELPGYNEFLNVPFNAATFLERPTHTQRLLGVFRRTVER